MHLILVSEFSLVVRFIRMSSKSLSPRLFNGMFDEKYSQRDQLLCYFNITLAHSNENSRITIFLIHITISFCIECEFFGHHYPYIGGHCHFHRYLIFKKLFLLQEKCKRAASARWWQWVWQRHTTSHCTPNEAFYMQSGRPISIWHTTLHLLA